MFLKLFIYVIIIFVHKDVLKVVMYIPDNRSKNRPTVSEEISRPLKHEGAMVYFKIHLSEISENSSFMKRSKNKMIDKDFFV